MHQNSLPFNPVERARFGWSRTRLRYHILEYLQKITFKKSAATIYLTDYAKRLVEKRIGHRTNLDPVICHGVSAKFQCKAKRQYPPKHYSSSKPFRFLYISIVNLYKHQWNIVEAIDRMRSRGYPISLDLVGPSNPTALKILRKTLDKVDPREEFIRYHGKISYNEIEKVYRESDSFVWASSCEAFGMILLEAMSASLPIACSSKSCSPELLQSYGWYFDPEDISSIEKALIALFENPKKRQEFIHATHSRAAEFTWDRCTKSTIEHLSATLVSHPIQ
ncbi:glycosyltransferase [Mariniblastus sp.]|nr:glycosyltransferase [Mariniblastus sp.]